MGKDIGANVIYNDGPASGEYLLDVPVPVKKLLHKEYAVSTSSTTAESVADIDIPFDDIPEDAAIWICIRDKAGPRAGYFYGSDYVFYNYHEMDDTSAGTVTGLRAILSVSSGGAFGASTTMNGVYVTTISTSTKKAAIMKKYASSAGTVDGVFSIDVFQVLPPDGVTFIEKVPS